MAAFNFGNLFGATNAPKDRRPDVMSRLAAVPIQDRTTAEVFRVMSEVGVENQGAMYNYLVKSGVVPKELDLYKAQQKAKEPSANELPLTPELLDLVQGQVPSYRPKTQPEAPLGNINLGAASMPLTPDILQGMVPNLKAAPVPGQMPQRIAGLPPEALFGAEAASSLAALPQMPVPGQTIPSTLVTQASEAATKAPGSGQRFGVDRESVAFERYRKPFIHLAPEEVNDVQTFLRAEERKNRAAFGSDRQIDIKDRKYILYEATMKPVGKDIKTFGDFDADTMIYAEPKYVEANNSLGKIFPIISTLDRLSKRLNTETDWKAAKTRGVLLATGGVAGFDEVATTYKSELKAWANLLAKHVAGQGGVLTERDTDRMVGAFASLFDTKGVRDAKSAVVAKIMQAEQDAVLANIRGDILNWADRREAVDLLMEQIDALRTVSDRAEREAKQERMDILRRRKEP